jgi:biofilm PGA synthesis N-glycosyltransferase PgaC
MDGSRLTGEGLSVPTAGTPYVLVTPARNEEAYIEETIHSVLRQTQRPLRWVLVSDGSTDRTDDIIRGYAEKNSFMKTVRTESAGARNFASKVLAFRRGYAEISHLPHELVGNLDADVTLPPAYYERALERLSRWPRLGICSAAYWSHSGPRLVYSHTRPTDAPGCVQLFRRECYEQIGGYLLLERGGEDTVAAIMARMAGWETRSFAEPRVIVRRPCGPAEGKALLRRRFAQGVEFYEWGAHPLFILAKAVRCIPEPPFAFGSAGLLTGYFGLWLRRAERKVPDVVVRFVRREQLGRLGLGPP